MNWQLFSAQKFPFCDQGTIKLKQNCIRFTNPCINLLGLPFITHEHQPKVTLEVFDMLQRITIICNAHWLGFLESCFFQWDISDIFCWDIVVTETFQPFVGLKLAMTPFISLYIWSNWLILIFFGHFKKFWSMTSKKYLERHTVIPVFCS